MGKCEEILIEVSELSLIIYFLRHGETTASQTGGYCGTLDPDLTPAGYQMAEDFADAYKSLPWVAVFSNSPLRRAVATAKPLCEATGIRMQLKEGLKEIAFGQWEGKISEEVNREFHDDYVRWSVLQPEFDAEKFRLAVVKGQDPDGTQLKPDMPRWNISNDDLADLITFLKTLP